MQTPTTSPLSGRSQPSQFCAVAPREFPLIATCALTGCTSTSCAPHWTFFSRSLSSLSLVLKIVPATIKDGREQRLTLHLLRTHVHAHTHADTCAHRHTPCRQSHGNLWEKENDSAVVPVDAAFPKHKNMSRRRCGGFFSTAGPPPFLPSSKGRKKKTTERERHQSPCF